MNTLSISICTGILLCIVCACFTEDLVPAKAFDSGGKGAYVRFVRDLGSTSINLLKAESASSYSYTVEFVDAEQGHLVTTYELELFYKDNDPANGDNSFGPILFKTFTANDFTTNSNGFRTVTVTVNAAEMMSAIGLSFDEIRAGDEFILDGRIVLQNGSQFGAENSSSAINGAAFRGFFDITFTCNCPSNLGGYYTVVSSDIWCGPDDRTNIVAIIAEGDGVYRFSDFSFGTYGYCYGGALTIPSDHNLKFTDICTEVSLVDGYTDEFGVTWSIDSEINGNLWAINWANTFGESATSVIAYPHGNWPITLK